uniref:Calcineurin-like phosphoesterase domain-containing protein n=2 Tax=Pseudo-nitzschia australis TaxID=44445 RepID=A0A7S4AHQ4_9STRA|mmetsp:Transcript_21902/g.47662  ORF Transcript_21902/g.47662 Transcript_21902/m.47662 type:complete len:650 (+) Transcript_21902:210-2159(+)|eukprot:CAMPEP_0168194218 /NCGR_PEP_ID=MMETSP0139_2-20121125/19058_1 /TAXON_ID=44445 /ORGANISM="Pseudo-nitzschia australis, Strain 10249 10 AB" /LENGTH=649 /DNA_ID=CAMNT_0008117697 /DNA_START=134 /DNA_END=2083 /DNA_ORIENTATION=+
MTMRMIVLLVGATTTMTISAFSLPQRTTIQMSTTTSNRQRHRHCAVTEHGEEEVDEHANVDFSSAATTYTFRDSWSLITLGDLHMEDDISHHEQARRDCLRALEDYPLLAAAVSSENKQRNHRHKHENVLLDRNSIRAICEKPGGSLTEEELQILLARRKNRFVGSHIVSLGDLGRKDIRHEPGDAGTTKSFVDAKAYFDGFEGIPYDLVTGNHDLEGLDEFDTDEANLRAWMDCFDNKKTPYFSRKIGERTLLVGLSTVRFRDAPYSSHEVHVDDDQIEWFHNVVRSHPDSEGWKILVFSHAPITGSGLRVLQSVHVTNGCAWLNHCSPTDVRNSFVRIVRDNPQIKCWLSGHFHLSHDYQDALVQAVPGSPCAFLQVGVMGPGSSRDQKRQSRMLRGCGGEFLQVFSINHHERDGNDTARVRLDATIDLRLGQLTYEEGDDRSSSSSSSSSSNGSSGTNSRADATETETAAVTAGKDSDWFQAYVPQPEDGCYLEDVDGTINPNGKTVCWWHMADGKVLGLHEGQLVEYDAETLSPLGVVVTKEQLAIRSKSNGNNNTGGGVDGSDGVNADADAATATPLRTKEVLVVQNQSTLVLVDDETRDTEVVHPNADGSYWRKFQRNKKIRLEEKAREEVARRWMAQNTVAK